MNKIQSTNDIKPKSLLRIYKKGFGYSKIEVIDINDYYLAALSDIELTASTDAGDKFNAYLWTNNETSYEFDLDVIGKIENNFTIIFFSHTNKISWSKKRKCLKLKTRIPSRFFPIDVHDFHKNFSSHGIKLLKGTVIELSDREALLQYSGKLNEGIFIKGHLLTSNGDIDYLGRIDRQMIRGGKQTYRLDLSEMHADDRNRILDFIISVYRE
jgi:hypothetical protein